MEKSVEEFLSFKSKHSVSAARQKRKNAPENNLRQKYLDFVIRQKFEAAKRKRDADFNSINEEQV